MSASAQGLVNFNSIKVRLKLGDVQFKHNEKTFQFHKGTIKTKYLAAKIGARVVFQFRKGTIKTHGSFGAGRYYADFNSIKVRLKPVMPLLMRISRKISTP